MRVANVENLSIGYNQVIVNDINFSIRTGELVSIVGKNGAGKSTLIKTLTGAIPPISGTVFLHDEPIQKFNPQELAQKVSVVFTNQEVNPMITVQEVLALGRGPYKNIFMTINSSDREKISHTINLLQIAPLVSKRMGELSDGQKQRVMIARALIQDTDLIILDEPTAHLDLSGKFSIFHLLKRLCMIAKKAIVVSTHEIDLALQHSDKMFFIKDNELIDATPEEIGFNYHLFEHFATSDIKFDYNLGKFVTNRKGIRQVKLVGSGELKYWVKHALVRNAIDIVDESHIEVHIDGDVLSVHVNKNHVEYVEDLTTMANYILSIKG